MKKVFKKIGGVIIDDLGAYLREYLKEHPGERVYIGCDSEDYTYKTQYAVTVCMHNPDFGKGVHFIFYKETEKKGESGYRPRKDEDWFIDSRMWNETVRVKEVADYLDKELRGVLPGYTVKELEDMGYESHQNRLVDICVDLNPVKMRKIKGVLKENKSNRTFDSSVGFLSADGYRVITKPEAWASSSAADKLLKRQRSSKRSSKRS